ncbi:MAG: hypothetical protein N3D14_02175, partial [Aquificaceae bacterium]|nr:hypothetical protein [Aquificaceae bacterium]
MGRLLFPLVLAFVSFLFSCGGGAGESIRSALFGDGAKRLQQSSQIPPITSSMEGVAISEDGKIVVGYSLPTNSAMPYYWKLRDGVTHRAFVFLEDQNSFQKQPLQMPSGVDYDYVIIRNMSVEGRCIVGFSFKPSTSVATAMMWTLDPQSGNVTPTALPTTCPTTYGNIAYDCMVSGNRYVVVGRTCPDSPHATTWENGNKVFESRFGTCFGIFHSISS